MRIGVTEGICNIISRQAGKKDFRPGTHHALFEEDETFDLKFNAIHRLQYQVIDSVISSIFMLCHKDFFQCLLDTLRSLNSRFRDRKKVLLTYVHTGLSDPDRVFLINCVKSLFDKGSVVYVDVGCEHHQTAFDLLTNIAEELFYCTGRTKSRPQQKQSIATGNTKSSALEKLREVPSRLIEECIMHHHSQGDRSKAERSLVVVLRHCDRLVGHVIGNLLCLLNELSCEVYVIGFISELCPIPSSFMNPTAQASVEISVVRTAQPWDMFDELSCRLLGDKELPVVLSPGIIRRLYCLFNDDELCLTSTVQRIVLVLSRHFSHRRSLLCMYRETNWLHQMKHTIRVSSSSHSDAITKLLEIMDVEDVQGTGVQLITADERSRSREVTQAEEALRSHHDRAFLEDCMVHCLKILRDTLLTRSQRRRFPVCLLWAEILSNKAAKRQQRSLRGDSTSSCYSIIQTRLISDLIHTLSDRLPKKPCTNVKSAIAELVTFLEGSIGKTSSSSYDSYLSTQLSTLRTVDETFDILADMMLGKSLTAESSWDDITRQFDIATTSHSHSHSRSSMEDISQLVDILSFYTLLLDDFKTWLSTLHQGFNDLSIPLASMEGILEVSSQTEVEMLQYLNTNCRSKFSSSINCPAESVPKISISTGDHAATSSKGRGKGQGTDTVDFLPDSFILGNKVMHSVGKELAGEWFDHFSLRLNQSKDRKHVLYREISDRNNNNQANNKKRKTSSELLDEPTMMKCRFVSALNDFERSGIIKCSATGDGTQKAIAIARHVYTWL